MPLHPRKRVNIRVHAKTLFMTIRTTRNFWDAFMLIFKARVLGDLRAQRVAFRNGITLNLTWREYNSARRIVFNGYVVRKTSELLLVEKGKMKLVGPPGLIDIVVNEELDKDYLCDCKNKVVLDVGGFIGDTATFFSMWGARKVIIYEPVIAFHKFIKMNVMLNGFDAELHEEGVNDHTGSKVVHYDTLNTQFGLSEGAREMVIQVKNVADVIQESHADIAKFDCEGGEASLNGVTNNTLRKIGTYLIEAHSPRIKNLLREKFKDAGFMCVREKKIGDEDLVSVLLFKRNRSNIKSSTDSSQP